MGGWGALIGIKSFKATSRVRSQSFTLYSSNVHLHRPLLTEAGGSCHAAQDCALRPNPVHHMAKELELAEAKALGFRIPSNNYLPVCLNRTGGHLRHRVSHGARHPRKSSASLSTPPRRSSTSTHARLKFIPKRPVLDRSVALALLPGMESPSPHRGLYGQLVLSKARQEGSGLSSPLQATPACAYRRILRLFSSHENCFIIFSIRTQPNAAEKHRGQYETVCPSRYGRCGNCNHIFFCRSGPALGASEG